MLKAAAMVKLTPKLIATEFPDEDLLSMHKLTLPGKGIEKIVRLSTCSQLIRLDLSNNNLTSLEGVSQNTTLKWLSAQSNQVTSLNGIDSLKQLQVLNLGHNALSRRLEIAGLPALRALMLNDNQVTGVDGLGACPDLNTVILKQNQISHLGSSLHGCTALAKLSVAHNKLSDVGSALAECSSLAELRISHNALTSLPQDLKKNSRLKIVEAGANQIAAFKHIQVLSQLPSLHQLNLRGCPIADTPDYHAQLLQQLPMLDVLDSRKVHKSSTHGSAKPAVPTAQSKPSLDRQAKSKPDVAGAARTVDSPVKNRKRQLQSQTEMLGAPVLKKIKNERVAASYDAMGTADGQTRTIATASKLGEKPGGGDDAEVERKRLKSGKKPKSKEGKKNPQQQATAAYSSRSFLADVLDPEEPDVAAKPAAKVENQQMSAAVATAGDSKASGLVKVVDIHKSQKNKKRTKHGNEAENKSGDNRASGLSGSSAAQVLQSGFGLAALQVGLGGSGAWN